MSPTKYRRARLAPYRLLRLDDRITPAVVTWDAGAGTANWADANNWDTNKVPQAGDDVVITTGAKVVYAAAAGTSNINSLDCDMPFELTGGTLNVGPGAADFAAALSVAAGTLGGAGTVTLAGGATMKGGTMLGTGKTVLPAGAKWAIDTSVNAATLRGRAFEVSGTLTWAGSNNVTTGDLGTLAVKSGGLFDVQADALWQFFFGSGAVSVTIESGGQFKKSAGAGTTTWSGPLSVAGTAAVETGTLLVTAGGTVTGAVTVTGSLTFNSSTFTFDAGGSLAGAGTVTFKTGTTAFKAGSSLAGTNPMVVNGGTLDVGTTVVQTASYTQSTGTLQGTGSVTLAGGATMTGGTMLGAGTTAVAAGKSWLLDTTANVVSLRGRAFDVFGTLTWVGTSAVTSGDLGKLSVKSGGLFDVQADAVWQSSFGAGPVSITVESGGQFKKSAGTGTTTLVGPFTVAGSAAVETGTLSIENGGKTTGTLAAAGNLTFVSNPYTFDAGGTLSGTGTMTLKSGTVTFKGGSSLAGTNPIDLIGGTLDLGTAVVQTASYTQSGGTLQGAGSLTLAGGATSTGGTMLGTGTTAVAAGKSWLVDTSANAVSLRGRAFDIFGTLTWVGTSAVTSGDSGKLSVKSGGLFDVQADAIWQSSFGSGPVSITVEAGGQFKKSAGIGTTTLVGPLTVAGSAAVETGTLSINAGGAVTGSLAAAGDLTFASANFTFDAGGSLSGAGTVTVKAGTTSFKAGASVAGTNPINFIGGFLDVANTVVQTASYTQSGGTLQGSGSLTLAGGATMTNGTMLGTGTTAVAAGKLWLVDTTANTVTLRGRAFNVNGTLTWVGKSAVTTGDTGKLSVKSGGLVDMQADANWTFAFGGGGVSITVEGGGTLRRSVATGATSISAAVTNNGTVEVDSGTLSVANGNSLTNFSGTTLTGGAYVIAGTFSFPGANIQTNAASITLDGPASAITAVIGGANALANMKTISGALTLLNGRALVPSGALANSGAVTIDSLSTLGTAAGNYSQSAGSTAVQGTLDPAGTVQLAGGDLMGNGTVQSDVNNTGGAVRPGSSPGLLSIVGSYTQSGMGAFAPELNGPTAIIDFDRLDVQGAVALGGPLAATLGYKSVSGENFVILTNDGTDPTTGTFTGIPENSAVIIGGARFRVNYNAGDGNDVVLTRLATGIDSIVVDDGSAQRSMIRSFTVTFGGLVTLPAAPSDAFVLTRTGPGTPGTVSVLVDTSASTATQTVAKLTFTGALTDGPSLADGKYTLAVLGAQVADQGGQAVDADNDGSPGGTNLSNLHRLFGDIDGDADVDAVDYGAFRSAFGGTNVAFDFDGDGDVDAADFGQFRQRFGANL